jgi:exo-beta-1,3-glucanase (GH17 family)
MTKEKIRVWEFDCLSIIQVAAATKDDALDLLVSIGSIDDRDDAKFVKVLSEDEMDTLKFVSDGKEITFRQRLTAMIMRGEIFPEIFAY